MAWSGSHVAATVGRATAKTGTRRLSRPGFDAGNQGIIPKEVGCCGGKMCARHGHAIGAGGVRVETSRFPRFLTITPKAPYFNSGRGMCIKSAVIVPYAKKTSTIIQHKREDVPGILDGKAQQTRQGSKVFSEGQLAAPRDHTHRKPDVS